VQVAFLSADTGRLAAAFSQALSPPELPAVQKVLQASDAGDGNSGHAKQARIPSSDQITAARRISKRAAALLAEQPSLADAIVRAHPLCQQQSSQLVDVLGALPEACHLAACQYMIQRSQGRFHVAPLLVARFLHVVHAVKLLPQVPALRRLSVEDPSMTYVTRSNTITLGKLLPALQPCQHLQAVSLKITLPIVVDTLPWLAQLSSLRELQIEAARMPHPVSSQAEPHAKRRSDAELQAALAQKLASMTQLTRLRLQGETSHTDVSHRGAFGTRFLSSAACRA
jgi:hypothetical protein